MSGDKGGGGGAVKGCEHRRKDVDFVFVCSFHVGLYKSLTVNSQENKRPSAPHNYTQNTHYSKEVHT